jgi:hypothetical protein
MGKKVTVKARMQALLDSLGYDFSRFTLEGFADWLAKKRGRPIVFVPRPMPASISGAWIKGAYKDYVFYEINTPTVHQAHIQLHEMSHMLCNHSTIEIGPQQAQSLFCCIDTQDAQSVLLRSVHTSAIEGEAETLTALIQEQVLKHNRMQELSAARPINTNLANYLKAMGF